MAGYRPFSKAEVERIIQMREDRKTWTEIGVKFGVKKTAMCRRVRATGQIPEECMKPARKDVVDAEILVNMLKEEKLSHSQIAARLGLKTNTVAKRIVRHGVNELAGIPSRSGPKARNKYTQDDLRKIESYLKEGYSWYQTSKILRMDPRSIRNHFPEYRKNGREAQRVRMYEYHINKKIDEAWGNVHAARPAVDCSI